MTPSKLVTHRYDFDDALEAYGVLTGEGEAAEGEAARASCSTIPADAALEQTLTLEALARANGRRGCRPGRRTWAASVSVVGFLGAGGFVNGVLLPTLKKLPGGAAHRRLHHHAA